LDDVSGETPQIYAESYTRQTNHHPLPRRRNCLHRTDLIETVPASKSPGIVLTGYFIAGPGYA
jgi:hypothetical protein